MNDRASDLAAPTSRLREALVAFADRFGATASFLCALHCAVLPFVVAVLPALGLGFLANHAVERAFVLFACSLGSATVLLGLRRHGDRRALALLLPGVGLLLGGIAVDSGAAPLWHALLVSVGGVLLSLAHLTNLRLSHVHDARCRHVGGLS